jgi:phosphoserine phosphatase
MKPIKLAVFDLEGTIFHNSYKGEIFPSLWAVLCNLCGDDNARKEDEVNRNKFYSGGYPGYSEWVIDTIKIHQKYKLSRSEFYKVIKSIKYFPGVEQTFTTLREKGITIAVISGGLKALADRVAKDYKIEHTFAAAEYFWNPDGSICHWNVMPTDFAHKRSVLEILCRDLGLSADECLFVGDGRNDRAVAGYCALSIGFNPHIELHPDVDVIIKQSKGKEDLSVVLQPIMKYPNFSLDDFSEYKIWKIENAGNSGVGL